MAFDEAVADRIHDVLKGHAGLTERRMFGGIAFLFRGHMCCGVLGDNLVLRLGDAGAAAALREPHTRLMDFTGKPMKSMIYVAPPGYAGRETLAAWLQRALEFAHSLPPNEAAGGGTAGVKRRRR